MPGGDRTGPWGRGSMTGRAMGFCAGYPAPGYTAGRGFGGRGFYGRGYGRGRGRVFGRGFGRGYLMARGPAPEAYPEEYYWPPVGGSLSPSDEKAYLEDVCRSLEQEIESIKTRLDELSKNAED